MPISLEERKARRLARKQAKERWRNAHKGWRGYSKNLKAAARMVGQIIKAHAPSLVEGDANWQFSLQKMQNALERYSKALEPWAESVARLMLAEVDRREKKAWLEHARAIGREIKHEIESAPTGHAYAAGMARQVQLITSLPIEASRRVHGLATNQLYSGLRGEALLAEILKTGLVTESRAELIARTEVARASTELTKARAEYIGSPGYIWRTALDADVRSGHKKLEGTFHKWDEPPLCDPPNHRAHPGQIWNCFPGDTLVGLGCGFRRIWRAPFDGELIRLVLRYEIIDVTPNHPILTAEGWKAADLLNPGDYLWCIPSEGPKPFDFRTHQGVTTFDKLFEASASCSGKTNVLRGFNFHGDVIHNDVDEIALDDLLSLNTQSVLFKDLTQGEFDWTDGFVGNPSVGSGGHIGKSDVPGVLDSLPTLFRRLVYGDDPVGLSMVPFRNAVSSENGTNGDWVGGIGSGERYTAFTRHVSLDDFLFGKGFSIPRRVAFASTSTDTELSKMLAQYDGRTPDQVRSLFQQRPVSEHFCRLMGKRTRKFSGHIYTIESDTGYYGVGVGQIVAKNCRCYTEVVIPDELSGETIPTYQAKGTGDSARQRPMLVCEGL